MPYFSKLVMLLERQNDIVVCASNAVPRFANGVHSYNRHNGVVSAFLNLPDEMGSWNGNFMSLLFLYS